MITNIIINNSNFLINSPLEQFEVVSLISLNLPIFGYWNLTLTNLALYSILVFTIIIGLHILGNNETNLVPSRWSIGLESSFASISSMVKSQIGNSNEQFLPFIYSLFFFIIIGNLTGNIPYSFAITASLIVTIGLSLTIFFGVTIYALYLHKIKFFAFFIPSGTPLMLVPSLVLIELISYIARAFSLGVRLFSNLMAGHTLLKILSTFLAQLLTSSVLIFFVTLVPFVLFIAIVGLELAVSIIQAYVFCVLTCSYIKDAVYLH
jgi:F-type H+-transporting ATPase subunit a